MLTIDRNYPPIPWILWVKPSIDTRRGTEGEILCWGAAANWREFGVVRWANTRRGAILLAIYAVVGFRLTGNGYFPEKKL